ncbi:MAG: DUF3445 domain-containing protein [Proteobacteria bacterium]|nr:DUF3445 domain-containing protein [Pseudomonadota bacterium]
MSLPRYRPYEATAADFQIGLKPMDKSQWLDLNGYASYLPQKRARLAADSQRYYRSLPSSLAAQGELLQAVTAHLLEHHGAEFASDGRRLTCRIDGVTHDLEAAQEPLLTLSQFIVEDFVILQEEAGKIVITAAANPYTSSGRIIASVGGGIPWAHEPVPGLNDKLGPRIDRILVNVREGVPAERFNWLVTAIGALLFPADSHAANAAASAEMARILADDPGRCGELLFIRAERQTLLRLPQTGAVAFSIHTYSDPLSSIARHRESLTGMAAALASYSPERLGYSAMTGLRDPVIRWIEQQLAELADPLPA